MSEFINDKFILENKYAEQLYFNHAREMPIIDYHNHLPPADIWEDRIFNNITEAWLEGDHYKWRAMRALGVDESMITGDADPYDKFAVWAKSVPYTMRNPLYHWTHMELKTYFGMGDLLDGSNARKVYDATTAQLQESTHSAVGLLEQMKVEVICTTDDPADSLEYHIQYRENPKGSFRLLPTWRPDKVLRIERDDYLVYLDKLGQTEDQNIEKLSDLLQVLVKRMDFFDSLGCRASDYGLDRIFSESFSEKSVEIIFDKCLNGLYINPEETTEFKSFLLDFLCRSYHEREWVQQFHLGALRNNSRRMLEQLGPDTGFDSMGDENHAKYISGLFDSLDFDGQLAKTILYNNNPKDNSTFATMAGNYNDGSVRGKMQFGSGWWFLDQKRGMEDQMNTLSEMGLLSLFVGMLTDSRSFLSFPRHDYFRRILCNLLGKDLEQGLLPVSEMDFIGGMVEDICYNNIKNYLEL